MIIGLENCILHSVGSIMHSDGKLHSEGVCLIQQGSRMGSGHLPTYSCRLVRSKYIIDSSNFVAERLFLVDSGSDQLLEVTVTVLIFSR